MNLGRNKELDSFIERIKDNIGKSKSCQEKKYEYIYNELDNLHSHCIELIETKERENEKLKSDLNLIRIDHRRTLQLKDEEIELLKKKLTDCCEEREKMDRQLKNFKKENEEIKEKLKNCEDEKLKIFNDKRENLQLEELIKNIREIIVKSKICLENKMGNLENELEKLIKYMNERNNSNETETENKILKQEIIDLKQIIEILNQDLKNCRENSAQMRLSYEKIINDLMNLLKNQINCEENLPAYDIIKNIREILSKSKNCMENKMGNIDLEFEKLDNYFQKRKRSRL